MTGDGRSGNVGPRMPAARKVLRRRYRLLEALLASALLFAALFFLHGVQNAFPLAETWADRQIEAGSPEASRDELVAAYRAAYGYQRWDGGWSPYVTGRDSYYYLRLAERILRNGTPCSPGVAETCWDGQANAPVGRPLVDAFSVHPYAVAYLHRLLMWLDRTQVLLDSARLLSVLVLGLSGVLLFLVGRRLAPPGVAGATGAFLAALATCLEPYLVSRTFGTDDDVWTLLLLSGAVLVASRGLEEGRSIPSRIGHAAAGGLLSGLLALSWGGWPFLFLLLAGGFAATSLFHLVRRRAWPRARDLALAALPQACILLGFLVVVLVIGVPLELSEQLGRLVGLFPSGNSPAPAGLPVQDAFASVAELQVPGLTELLESYGVPALLALLGLATLVLRLLRGDAYRLGGTVLLLVWLAAGLPLIRSGERHLVLLIPPLMVLAGVGLASLLALLPERSRALRLGTAVLVLALVGGTVGWRAVTEIAGNRPALDSAWVRVLTHLRETTPADTLLLTAWDAGHWSAFWSARGVAVDGASLRSPRVEAVGRLLAANADHGVDAAVAAAACPEEAQPCQPGPIVLITSNSLLANDSWMITGLWRPERAAIVDALAAGRDPAEFVAGLEAEGLDRPVAEALVRAAADISDRRARAFYAAPQARVWSTGWHPCALRPDGSYECQLSLTSADGWRIESLRVDPARPNEAAFRIRRATGEAAGAERLLRPSMIRLATADHLLELVRAAESDTNPGILLDTVSSSVFVATPAVLRSLAVRLVLLDGRFDKRRFEQLIRARTVDGAVVQAWRVVLPSPANPGDSRP